jgi:hypothetical protein
MTAAELLAELPDEAVAYVPGVGEVSLGEIVAARTEQTPGLAAEREATLEMWARVASDRLCLEPWERTGAGRPGGRP